MTEFILGVGVGVLLTLFLAGMYRLYCVLATRYLLTKMKNELQKELLDARQQLLDDTIKQLEDHANDED